MSLFKKNDHLYPENTYEYSLLILTVMQSFCSETRVFHLKYSDAFSMPMYV